MNTPANETQENKSQTVANPISQNKSSGEQTFQLADNRPEAIVQRKLHEMANNILHQKEAAQLQAIANSQTSQLDAPLQKKATSESAPRANNTGLPDGLKSGIENLSGYSMDDVKVHRNSDKPAQLQAHAYAQGTDIHLGPGQEKHLPHEAWHVVQQKQGRVKPTMQLKGKVNVNDDVALEKEADVMGAKALQLQTTDAQAPKSQLNSKAIAQLAHSSDNKSDESVPSLEAGIKKLETILGQATNKENEGSPDLEELKKKILALKKIETGTDTAAKSAEANALSTELGLLASEGLSDARGVPIQRKQDGTVQRLGGLAIAGIVIGGGIVVAGIGLLVRSLLRRNNAQEADVQAENPVVSDLEVGVNVLVRYEKVGDDNTIIERIQAANGIHQQVYDLLSPILPKVITYMQGSGGQVQNALSLIGAQSKVEDEEQRLENMVMNFCAIYDPSDLDFSDIDILIPVQSTKGFGRRILSRIRDGLEIQGAEIRSAAALGDNSSFSHIFLKIDDTDIDIVIQDMRFAEFYAPKFPHMAARATVSGEPGFIKTHEEELDDGLLKRSDSVDDFADLTVHSGAQDLVTAHMGDGLESEEELRDKNFNFEQIQQSVEEKILAFQERLKNPEDGGDHLETLTQKIDRMIEGWVEMKKVKSAEITEKLQMLEQGEDVGLDRRAVSEKTEFRKNQKQYYKSAKLEGNGDGTMEQKKSVVAFYHMLAQHLNPGELDEEGAANFTASLLAKKGYAGKDPQAKADWLEDQISKLKSVQTYFGALIQMGWAPDNEAVTNASEYFLRQQAIFKELKNNIEL